MSEYLILDLLILAGPLLASFDRQVRFIQYLLQAFVSIIVVGAVYIGWDAWAASRGHWAFNPDHVHSIRFLGLPLEEILFFVVVPYASLFVWKTILFYRREKEDKMPFTPYRSGVLIAAVGIAMWFGKGYEYTAIAAWATALFLFADYGFRIRLTSTVSYWFTQGFVVLATLIFNGYLTARPIVTYGEAFQLGLRIYTIPVEDFVYGFSLTSWVMLVFSLLLQKK